MKDLHQEINETLHELFKTCYHPYHPYKIDDIRAHGNGDDLRFYAINKNNNLILLFPPLVLSE